MTFWATSSASKDCRPHFKHHERMMGRYRRTNSSEASRSAGNVWMRSSNVIGVSFWGFVAIAVPLEPGRRHRGPGLATAELAFGQGPGLESKTPRDCH